MVRGARLDRRRPDRGLDIEDIGRPTAANRKLMHSADHDQLTGTLSRRAIEQARPRGRDQLGRNCDPALAYMDLGSLQDGQRPVRTTAGDEVLRQLCASW